MNIVEPYARVVRWDDANSFDYPSDTFGEFGLTHGIALLRKIEWCGRISHRSEDGNLRNWRHFFLMRTAGG